MKSNRNYEDGIIHYITRRDPDATARIRGSDKNRGINGMLKLYQTQSGVFVICFVQGLPVTSGMCAGGIYAVHIHDGDSCTGNEKDPFADAGSHYNPYGCPHPFHAGDLPPLFADNGFGWYAVLTARFDVNEVIGKTVIIHSKPDDFTTQPSGNSGEKIACGKIMRF